MEDRIRKLYIDGDINLKIDTDDFLIAIGKKQSNSVYHVVEAKKTSRKECFRFHVKVLKSDLITCLKRDKEQRIITVFWYNRNKN